MSDDFRARALAFYRDALDTPYLIACRDIRERAQQQIDQLERDLPLAELLEAE